MNIGTSVPVIPCFFGTDIPERNQLLAHNRTVMEKCARIIGVDSLGFLSLGPAAKIAVGCKLGFCDALLLRGNLDSGTLIAVNKNKSETEIPLP